MKKIILFSGFAILFFTSVQKKEIEIFDKNDLEFFNLKGPVKDFAFIVVIVIGDYDAKEFSFEKYSKYVDYQNILFDKKGFVQSINTHYAEGEFERPRLKTTPIRVRNEDTLTIDMTTSKEEKWIKYIFNNTSLSIKNYTKSYGMSNIIIDERFTKFSYDLNGSWSGYESGKNEDFIYDKQNFKTILNTKKNDSLVFVVDNGNDKLMYSIVYLEYDSYGNWTKRVLEKHIPYLGYGTNSKYITEIRKINYY
ncbi:hypothetical protein NAT47_09055 [Flavobacterium sp. HXWNR69]|uniref:Uncharacterized protein n=1 Tax=Flavobacterium fragile TaxID=2949085 RepID=A0ABT0TIZ6_9FLAO|nr:hypothetical protein [Flavobacterium sp. HXWNR69]MCL9770566.1 hypothetical protein [Flavobacterium sp. HXWNR69]